MAMNGFTKDMNIIQKLNDEPNDRDGLTAGELKAKFDEGGLAVKDYLNNTVKPHVDGMEDAADTHAADAVKHITAEERANWNNKVDKVSGKGLSTNDYTTAEKNKLAGIEAQANKYTHPAYTARTGKPTANLTPGFGDTVTVSQITSDASGHVTGAIDRTIKIPATAASPSAAGLMSAADKTKLNGIAAGAQVNSITGVKGNAEGSYRTGNVNLTPANLGAAPASHTHTSDTVTDLVTATAYGPAELVSFQDAHGGLPLNKCLVSIMPAQSGSGNPTPANVRPISGREHVKVWRFGKNFFPQADVVVASGTGNETIYFPQPLPAGTYVFSADLTSTYNGNCIAHIIRADNTTITVTGTPGTRAALSFTSPSGNEIIGIRFYVGDTYNTSYNNSGAWSNIQVETGSTATAYEASETVVDADLPELVYGGTLDVLTGKLTIDKKVVVIKGDASETWSSVNQSHSIALIKTSGIAAGALISSHYTSVTAPVKWGNLGDNQAQFSIDDYIGYKDTANNGTSVATAKAYAQQQYSNGTPITFVGKLKNPVIYQLTPGLVATLAGQNRIWADAGNITVEYGAFLQALEGAAKASRTYTDLHYVTAGKKIGTTLGKFATAEGYQTTANGDGYDNGWCNHAEGWFTVASGDFAAHAEGYLSKAIGPEGAHAEGYGTIASGGWGPHAEGVATVASGDVGAHAEGDNTVAAGNSQHVFGRHNISNTTDVEIVGWGSGVTQTKKNIRTLDRSGNMTIAGTLTQSSDARLKDVQGEVPDVSGIRAVRFKWNDTNGEHDDRDHIGYLAQEVEKIAPYLVGDDSNGYKSLDYIALLCAKVEWLERKVKVLQAAAETEGGN